MDFVISLPNTAKGCDFIWVIMDILTKLAHFIPIKISYPLQDLVELYIEKVVSLHGIPSSIMSDQEPRFTLKFGESFLKGLGTKLRLSFAYHPHMDGQTERNIQSLEDLLRAYMLKQEGAWDIYLPLIEFTHNNSFRSSIRMSLFEDLYGRRCRTPFCWYESGESVVLGRDIVQQKTEKTKLI